MNWKHLKKTNLGKCNEFTTLSTRFDRSNDCCMDFAWKWNIQMNVFVALMNLSDSSRAGKLRLAQWDGPKLLSTGGRPEEVWPRRKILGIFFAPHFGCSTTGNFRAKLQFRKRFAIAKPCFALQFPLENTSVETVTTRELVRSVGRRRVRPSRCQSVPQVSSGQRTCNWTNYANTFCSMGADRWKVPGRGYSFLRAKSKYQPLN